MRISEEADASFRRESARLVSQLTRAFGIQSLSIVEDAVQDTFIKAVEIWPIKGVPENPPAWLMLVAKRHVVDGATQAR